MSAPADNLWRFDLHNFGFTSMGLILVPIVYGKLYILKLSLFYLLVKTSIMAFPNSLAALGPLAVMIFPSRTIDFAS